MVAQLFVFPAQAGIQSASTVFWTPAWRRGDRVGAISMKITVAGIVSHTPTSFTLGDGFSSVPSEKTGPDCTAVDAGKDPAGQQDIENRQ